MRLIEKEAKQFLQTRGIQTPIGFFVDWSTTAWPTERVWNGPYYLKAQVLEGRRGKNGLVQRCENPEDFKRILSELHARLSKEICAGFWCEELQPHVEEWFVACDIDRATGLLRAHVSQQGGKEVATVTSFTLTELGRSDEGKKLPIEILALLDILASALSKFDALSIEINPCVITQDRQVIALDAKIELDEAAAFRHPEWNELSELSRFGVVSSTREQAYLDLLLQNNRPLLGKYVELSGTIAVVLAGGGASLVAMDALARTGLQAANYLELSGNPDPEFLRQAAKIVFSHPNLQAIWIAGSFANFTDIEMTVAAILQAVEESGLHVPIFIRRDGPSADAAERASHVWAKRYGVPLVFERGSVDLEDSARTLAKYLQNI